MFTLSSDGNFSQLSTWIAISDYPEETTQWQFDDNAFITGASASHVFDEPGWHQICMRSCSGNVETQVCSAINVDSYLLNRVEMTVAPSAVAQGVNTSNFQVCLSSICPPPFRVDLVALSSQSTHVSNIPSTVWSSLIPQHAFYDVDGNIISGLILQGTPITVSGSVVGYEACGCFTYKDDLPTTVQIVANYEPECDICRPERSSDSIYVNSVRIGGTFEYIYSSIGYTGTTEPFVPQGYFGSTSDPWNSDTFTFSEIDRNGNSIEPLRDAIYNLSGSLIFTNTQTNTGVSGNFLGLSTYTSVSGHTVYTGTFGTNPPAFLDDVPIDGTVYTLQWEFLQDQPECPLPASGSFVEELLQTANHTIYDPIDCNTYIGYPLEGELSESSFPKMEIVEDLDTNSVLYLHFDDSTGYGNAARGYIKDLEESGIDVQKMDISNESTPPNSPYHTVIIHAPAPIWKMYLNKYGDVWKNCKIIGNTVWETETAPVGWVEPMDMVDEIWLPTNWNQKTFIDAGVKTPILVKPHIFVGDKDYKKVNQLGDIQKGDDYVFYSIGVWSDSRKRMGDLIRLFCKTFTGNDQVQLVVKTSYKGYEKKNLETCHKEAAAIINRFSNPPKIHIITDQYDDSMISKLHGYGDCFVSLTHTEGWGLGAFEAHSYGKPVIITGFGGQLEYLGDDYPGLINYTKVPCSSKDFPDYHSWAEPDEKHASVLMKATYEHRP